MLNRIYQVLGASISSFTPALDGQNLTLTSAIANLNPRKIKSIILSPSVAGTEGVYHTGSSATPVIGTVYYLVVGTNQQINGQRATFIYHATADTTTWTDLVDKFVLAINATPSRGFVALKSSSQLQITIDSTQWGLLAGEVIASTLSLKNSSGVALDTFTTGTAAVIPVGHGAQIARNNLFGVHFVGSVTLTATYTTVAITSYDKGETFTSVLYIDETTTAADLAYFKSVIKNYISKLELGAGDTVALTAVTTVGTSGSAVLPKGATEALVTSAGSTKQIALSAAGLPIGTKTAIEVGANGFTIKMPTGETLNAGVAAGGAACPASHLLRLEKTSPTNWYGAIWANDGTAPDSTGEDMPASS